MCTFHLNIVRKIERKDPNEKEGDGVYSFTSLFNEGWFNPSPEFPL